VADDHKILNGKAVAAAMYDEISQGAAALTADGFAPNLVSVSVGVSKVSQLYVRNQQRVAAKVGIGFEPRDYPGDISVDELTGIIGGLNTDPRVTGIIIQRPVPDHVPVRTLQAKVHPMKDVEGMHPSSIGNIVYNEMAMGPCTAVAAVELLKTTGLELKGLEVVIVGHSEIVGKPIAFLLMSEGATVTVCHHMTRNLRVHSRTADAVFVAVGKPGLVTGDMIKPGAALIDIGINQIVDEAGENKVVGDVDFESCLETAGWITPVPGGVGPVTVAVLMKNSVTAAGLIKGLYQDQLERG